ncbi:MAG TPA: Lpg1974 family pore-forming outer membrane protein, partial [Caulobacteraceae bacterium]|nr:Lpg1974 family pore-forming outer membrane protein [Caulobacteraceae bacterium]
GATAEVSASRSRSVTVPTAAVSLGLAYEVQRIKIAAGYRWERYFDVLDGGHEEGADADRTIDGPYFKISVGFGG